MARTAATRSNFKIKIGTYTGDGTDDRNITGVGFRPSFVLVKGGANLSIYRTHWMVGDQCLQFGGSTTYVSDRVQSFVDDGFQIGTNAEVNANGTVYHYLAIDGSAAQVTYRTGKYVGDSTDNRNFTGGDVNFTPDIFLIKGSAAFGGAGKIKDISTNTSFFFNNNVDNLFGIYSFISNGVKLGTGGRVNNSGSDYFFIALKHLSGVITSGIYTGDGTNARKITGLGFQPDFVFVKNGTSSVSGIVRFSTEVGDESQYLINTAPAANLIESLDSDGFTIGNDQTVNENASTHYWFAFKAGTYNSPLNRQ